MRKPGALVLAAFGLVAVSDVAFARSDKKPTPEPFYQKYLVAGDPLDDKIVEQEQRVAASPDDASLHNDLGNLLAQRRFPAEAAHDPWGPHLGRAEFDHIGACLARLPRD